MLASQFLYPVGTPVFHFHATGDSMTWGPYFLPPMTMDAVALDVSFGTINAISLPVRLTVQ